MNTETMVRRIRRVYERATAAQLAEGYVWYPEAHGVARECPTGAHDGAVQLAALSPQLAWSRNVSAARDLWAGRLPVGVLGRSIDNALALRVNGPKTSSFAANIANPADPYPVTIDRHAVAIATGHLDRVEHGRILKRKGGYDGIAHAYRLAAKRLDVLPNVVQAVTWTVWRSEHAYERGN